MNLHLRSTSAAMREQTRGCPRTTIAGLVIALALIASVGAYQFAGHRDAAHIRATSHQSLPGAASPGGERASAIGQPAGQPIVFIVSSQEHAATLRAFTAIPRDVWTGIGPRPQIPQVLISDLDAVTIAEALPRTPGTLFVDLRTN